MADKFSLDTFLKKNATKPSHLDLPNMVLLYGKAGSGKTWLAASEALECQKNKKGKVLIIDTEGSTVGTTFGLPDEYLDIVPVTDSLEFDQLILSLLTEKHDYTTVVIDTFDVQHDRKAQLLLKTTRNDKGQIDTRAAWGVLRTEQVAMLRKLKSAPFRTILVVHETVDKLDTGARYTGLALSGSTADILPGIPDMVGWTTRGKLDDSEEIATIVEFTESTLRDTKNRFGLRAFKNPTMTSIYTAIKNKQGEAK